MYRRIKTHVVQTVEMMNFLLQKSDHLQMIYRAIDEHDENVSNKAFLEEGDVNLCITMIWKGKLERFIFRLDGAPNLTTISGGDAYMLIARDFKTRTGYKLPQHFLENCSRPLLMRRRSTDCQRHQAYGYDMNNAYAFGLIQTMPDTTKEPRKGFLRENEIGFYESELGIINKDLIISQALVDQIHVTDRPGDYADEIFPAIPSPFIDFVDRWIQRREKAKKDENPIQRQKAKDVINFSVGCLRNHNTYLHSRVMCYVRDYMLSHIDDNTIYCNTDSLVSTVERKDLPFGEKIGQFKVEHEGLFAYKGFAYQWTIDDIADTRYRGISREWFRDDYDILKDPLPGVECSKYIYNPYKNRIEVNKEWQESRR